MAAATLAAVTILGLLSLPAVAAEPDRRAVLKQLEDVVDLLDSDYQSKPINAVKLPKELAIKSVIGNGSRVVYTF
jgi:hypothetical protein